MAVAAATGGTRAPAVREDAGERSGGAGGGGRVAEEAEGGF